MRQIYIIIPVISLLCVYLLTFATSVHAEDSKNTVFLPLKINALANQEELTTKADDVLARIADDKNLIVPSRKRASQALDYENWPPSLLKAAPLLPKDFPGYLASGSITKLGTVLSIDIIVRNLTDTTDTHTFYREVEAVEELSDSLELLVAEIWSYTHRQQLISSIEIKGNKRIDSGAIRQKISTRSSDKFRVSDIRSDLKEIFRMGYFDDIRVETESTPEGRVVTFTVVEKNIVGKIIIKGNDKVSEEDIREVIKIRSNSIINEPEIAHTIANIRNLYKEKG